ncbi:hypothetical protein [Mycobacterium sp. C31M]
MKTVLGLSVTTTGVGWVLVDATAPDGHPIDDDQFAIGDPESLVPRCLAAVRGAAAIAGASGHRIATIGVCWSTDLDDRSAELLTALRGVGCADVRPVRQVRPVAAADAADGGACAVDPGVLLADLFDTSTDFDTGEADDTDERTPNCGPDAEQTSAYEAAHAVLTNVVPAERVREPRVRRDWSLPPVGARVLTLSGAAAVTAVIALFAVGSQFGGAEMPESATLANRATVSTPQEAPAEAPAPAAAAPLAAAPEVPAAPAPEPAAAPPSMTATQPAPTAEWVPPAQPVVAQEVPPAPEAVPHIPDPAVPLATPEAPVAAAVPVEPAPPLAVPEQVPPPPAVDHAAPVVLPTDPMAGTAVGPAPGPAPAQLPPPPPVDPIQAAIASLFPPPAPVPAPVPAP